MPVNNRQVAVVSRHSPEVLCFFCCCRGSILRRTTRTKENLDEGEKKKERRENDVDNEKKRRINAPFRSLPLCHRLRTHLRRHGTFITFSHQMTASPIIECAAHVSARFLDSNGQQSDESDLEESSISELDVHLQSRGTLIRHDQNISYQTISDELKSAESPQAQFDRAQRLADDFRTKPFEELKSRVREKVRRRWITGAMQVFFSSSSNNERTNASNRSSTFALDRTPV